MIKNKTKKILIFIIVLNLFVINISFAHPGRTDSNGGHWNRSTGTYHYHNGEYAGQSTSSSSSSETSSWEKYKAERQSSTIETQSTDTKTSENTLKKQDSNFDLWSWIAIALLVFLYGVPFAMAIIEIIIKAIKSVINKIKSKTTQNTINETNIIKFIIIITLILAVIVIFYNYL